MKPGMSGQVIIPASSGADGYVELAHSRNVQGRVFRKHILDLGTLIHPKTGEKLQLDEAFYDKLKANFDSGVCPVVQIPLADAQNRHSEDPARNLGEVVGLERDGSKVYAVMDIRDPDAAGKMGKTLLGASAFLNLDYKDTSSGRRVGPALLHACVTNRPYVTGLDDYEEVVAASADGSGETEILLSETVPAPGADEPSHQYGDDPGDPQQPIESPEVPLTEEEPPVPTKDELIAQLKAEHGIDVAALQASAAAAPDTAQLTAALTAALRQAPGVQLSAPAGDASELSLSDVVGAVAELAGQNQAYGSRVVALERQRAESEIDAYIGQGRVLPKQRSAFVDLALTNRDMLDTLLPEEPVVALNAQEGVGGMPQGEASHAADIDAELLRLTTQGQTKHFFEAQQPPARRGRR